MLWLFLPTLATAGFFSDHVAKYLKDAVDPCDNFYNHVCSSAITEGRFFLIEGGERMKNLLEQLASPAIQQFRNRVTDDIENHPDESMLEDDLRLYEEFVGDTEENCTDYESFMFVNGFQYYDAYYRLQSTPHFNVLKKKLTDIFTVLKDILVEEFTEAPWTKRYPHLMNFIRTVKLNHMKALDFELEKGTEIMNERYGECLRVTSNFTNSLAKKCLTYAACPISKRFRQTVGKEEEAYENGAPLLTGEAFTGNAMYNPKTNQFTPMPFFYALEEDELPYMIGSIDIVFSHELGHVFFNGNKSIPANFECFRQHMFKACLQHVKYNFLCKWYTVNHNDTSGIIGVYPRFNDDAADWIGMHAGIKALQHYFPQTSSDLTGPKNPETVAIIKKFFYAHAINWCVPDPNSAFPTHSPAKVRVNGIVSLFPEFSETFGCKRGSKMAKAATCLPFAGVGAPTRKRHNNHH